MYNGVIQMLLMNSPSVQRVPIDSLKLPAKLLRRHPKKEIEKIQKLLTAYGQVPPILAAPNGEIIFREEVWLALKAEGATEVDVIIVAGKSPRDIQALQLALHRIPLDAVWDEQNVRDVLEELISVEFDVELTGFDAPEIDSFFRLDMPGANVEENGSDIPPLQPQAVSVPGTIWALGDHRIGCGSATDPIFVSNVLGDKVASCAFVDPPYNIQVDGFVTGKGQHRHREFVQGAGELSPDEYFAFLKNSLLTLKRCCAPTALIFACIDWRHVMEMTVAGHACDMPLYNLCVWTKTNGGMGGIYRNAHELVCVFRAGNESPQDNVELGRHGRNRTNVWSYPGMSSFGKEREKLLSSHPTVKPVAMIADALRDVTKRGQLVIDTFLGSGSTLMAAQETGRICHAVELDPLYVDVAVRRWQNATGRDAVVIGTNERFNDAAQRLLTSRPLYGD